MTPGARLAAAIELLDAVIAAAREGGTAADTLIVRYRPYETRDIRSISLRPGAATRPTMTIPATAPASLSTP